MATTESGRRGAAAICRTPRLLPLSRRGAAGRPATGIEHFFTAVFLIEIVVRWIGAPDMPGLRKGQFHINVHFFPRGPPPPRTPETCILWYVFP